MKQLTLYIFLLLLLLSACKTTKRVTASYVEKSHDSVAMQATQQADTSKARYSYKKETDTAIGIKGKKLEGNISKEETELPRTSKGKAVPRHFEKKEDGLAVWVHIDTLGNIKYGASSDSLTLVIKNLVYSYDSLASRQSNNQKQYIYITKTKYSAAETTIRKVVKWRFWPYIIFIALAAALFFVGKWFFKKYL